MTNTFHMEFEPPEEPNLDNDADAQQNYDDEIDGLIRNGCGSGNRVKNIWRVIYALLRRGYQADAIVAMLLDPANGISAQLQRGWIEDAVVDAIKKLTFSVGGNGNKPHHSQANICIALLKLKVTVRHDEFADRTLIEGLSGFGPVLVDAAMNRLWLLIDQRFKFRPGIDFFHTVITDTARLNRFHPVRQYLDGLQWDGVKRIDKWLTTYGGAVSSKYTDAVGALFLVAGVRRIRQPGCKFDEMMVLECPKQGTNKSEALKTLAVNSEWFTDDVPLNVETKRVIEALSGRWIVEAAELNGLKRADVEHLKSFLSRSEDRARMAWGRLPKHAPRQCVISGTTNSQEYLKDQTGNRRFWPVRVTMFDLVRLLADRDQLWAEAAAREASGVSIRLDEALWPEAAQEQAQRTADDPYYEMLFEVLGDHEGKISSETLWLIIGENDLRRHQRSQFHQERLTVAMNKLGWGRTKSRMIKINIQTSNGTVTTRNVVGYVKGPQPWKTIKFVGLPSAVVPPDEIEVFRPL